MRKSESLGMVLLFAFVIAGALRDVFLNHTFAALGPFQFALTAFSTATVFFLALALIRAPRELLGLRKVWREVIAINVTSAVAWLSYLGALQRVEPAVVNTIFAGVGPLTVTLLSIVGLRTKAAVPPRPAEHATHVGLAMALAFIVWVVLSGHAAPIRSSLSKIVLGLALAFISGTVITAETVIAKRMNEAGISAGTVVAVRFLLTVLIAGMFVAVSNQGIAAPSPLFLGSLILPALLLIVLPIYVVQLGLAQTSPMTTNVILTLQPVAVFFAQSLLGRQKPSQWVLGAIGIYAVFSLAGVILPLRASLLRRPSRLRIASS